LTGSAEDRLRALCPAPPRATGERARVGDTVRVRHRVFVVHLPGGRHRSVRPKAPGGRHEGPVETAPGRFRRSSNIGPRGWIGARLAGDADRAGVALLVPREDRLAVPLKPAQAPE
jgi:hypothetical protein